MKYDEVNISERSINLGLEKLNEAAADVEIMKVALAEEEKQSPAAIQYWFHVLDTNGDGVIDTQDMWYFYEEQQRRLTSMNEVRVSRARPACRV